MSQIHFVRGIAAGALAGLAASWVMNRLQTNQCAQSSRSARSRGPAQAASRQPRQHKKPEHNGAGDNATVKTAEMISQKVFHRDLTPVEKRLAGPVVHYAYGSLVGGIYGGLAELMPIVAAGVGMPFGFALWLLGDEIAVPALGLGKSPLETPGEVHADALAAHFMYGATMDLCRRVLRHVL